MDSLTQVALGAAVGTAVLGRKAGPRAALWGAVCGTLPDLDVLVPFGDPVRDFTFHRAESHSLFWLTLASPPLAWVLARVNRATGTGFRDWLWLVWLVLITHPLLDAFTVYGTQLLLPFSDYPFGAGSIFIIDPLYTLPLFIGVIGAIRLYKRDAVRAMRWNGAGIMASTAYLIWTLVAQAHIEGAVHRSLAASPLADGSVLATPTPFNSLLWRVLVMDEDGYHEGFRSILDEGESIEFIRHASMPQLVDPLRDDWTVRRLAWFSKGFYSVREAPPDEPVAASKAGTIEQVLGLVESASAADTGTNRSARPIVMTDLRMGQTPWFVFSFVVGERIEGRVRPVPSRHLPAQRPPTEVLGWLGRRIFSEQTGPPPDAR